MDAEILTFQKGGIDVNESKELTERHPIETTLLPSEVHILLNQHFGATGKTMVKKNI
jgi:Na+-translocating ferredoxin:NAD+ oxidoreductase RnfC subunit